MLRSVLTPCEELQHQLMNVGSIVNHFRDKKNDAVPQWLQWLEVTEEILKKNNFSETSALAGLRADILAVAMEIDAPRKRKKAIAQKSLESVNVAQDIVASRHNALQEKIEQVRTLFRQIVPVAKQAGLIRFGPGQDFTAFMEDFLQQLQQHEQLGPGITAAIAAIGKTDTLRIMADEIDLT
ncbi:hypothetical protein [Flavilitoribacter nigricans]|uniref:Uncharacterized protein n=1 Tax=Flavilitoribacter nigricans (strain ATCC 23147 / DSM 23189 / NBRC 102662 / NCIMB 1420 / SS-2) TaxID=1122177 RepID=A0A2D0NHE3_FLAN2|nr:hypothetical protein [Flavilitoribacter nigricans]PHN07806.1 hypothetical protein CRP01_04605 [Flavilitoribacter nigricans DSM 23189 = NBRC 102662]